jgi:hypothetical protein
MKNRLLFIAGLATGYVVGSRAGRSAYTTLTERLRTIRSSDAVQSAVGSVTHAVQEKAPGLTAAVSQVAETTAAVADAAASAPDPEQDDSQQADSGTASGLSGDDASSEGSGSADDASSEDNSSSDDTSSEPTNRKPRRASRSRTAAAGTPGESAEEAAKVFEEQLPEAGGAIDDAASSITTEPGQADEAANPTATS